MEHSDRSAPRIGTDATIWLSCTGIGLLFMARGAFQPYAFPLFEHLGGLSYGNIALLLNGYVMAQSVLAPLAGWYTDRLSTRTALATTIVLGLASFSVIATAPGWGLATLAVFVAGFAFVLGKIALNTILVLHSSQETLRRSVAKRATLLNLGSFAGNSLAYQVTTRVGYASHAVVLAALHLPLLIGLLVKPEPGAGAGAHRNTMGLAGVKTLCRNGAFVSDAIRRFALVLPYGCWGTIIPKYVIDLDGTSDRIWVVYLVSLCTTVAGAHLLAVSLSALAYRCGFKWEWWSMVSVAFYCTGLLLLTLAKGAVLLPLAVVVFICGEVLMTPCFDETAKRHSSAAGMGTCMGLLHLVDGFGRMLGAAFALAVYGAMKDTPWRSWFWPVVVGAFLVVCISLHVVAHVVAERGQTAAPGQPAMAPGAEISLPETE